MLLPVQNGSLPAYRVHLEQKQYASATADLQLAVVSRVASEAAISLAGGELTADQLPSAHFWYLDKPKGDA